MHWFGPNVDVSSNCCLCNAALTAVQCSVVLFSCVGRWGPTIVPQGDALELTLNQ